MERKFKTFDISIRVYNSKDNLNIKAMKNFIIQFDKRYIYIKNNSFDNILRVTSTAINKNTWANIKNFSTESFNITRFSTNAVNELLKLGRKEQYSKYNIICFSNCYVCHQKAPIFLIKGKYDDDEIYLCKKHLRKFYECLNSVNASFNCIIEPAHYTVSVKD